jgi:ATP-dependent helicase HrpA
VGEGSARRARELVEECLAADVDALVAEAGGPAWDAAGFAGLAEALSEHVVDLAWDVLRQAARIRSTRRRLEGRLEARVVDMVQLAVADVAGHLTRLAGPGFVARAGADRLDDVERYLRPWTTALNAWPPSRPATCFAWARCRSRSGSTPNCSRPAARAAVGPGGGQIAWMLEELRVSLFAQTHGTPDPVSEQRIGRAMEAVAAGEGRSARTAPSLRSSSPAAARGR